MRESGRNLELLLVRAGPLQFQQHITTLCNYLWARDSKSRLPSFLESRCGRPPGLEPSVEFRTIQWTTGGSRIGEAGSRLKAPSNFEDSSRPCGLTSCTLSIAGPCLSSGQQVASLSQRAARQVYHTFDMLEPGIHFRPYLYLERRMCGSADLIVNTDRARAITEVFVSPQQSPLYVRNSVPLQRNCGKR